MLGKPDFECAREGAIGAANDIAGTVVERREFVRRPGIAHRIASGTPGHGLPPSFRPTLDIGHRRAKLAARRRDATKINRYDMIRLRTIVTGIAIQAATSGGGRVPRRSAPSGVTTTVSPHITLREPAGSATTGFTMNAEPVSSRQSAVRASRPWNTRTGASCPSPRPCTIGLQL